MLLARSIRARGFTLIELLVVIAIIAILVALLLPAVQQVREAARKSQCQDHLHNLGIALHSYEGSFRTLPPGAMTANQLGWHTMILPQIEQKPLYDKFDFSAGTFNGAPNQEGPNRNVHALNMIDVFMCPSSPYELTVHGSSRLSDGRSTFTTHYYGVMGPFGTNPVTNTAYAHDPNPTGHGGFCSSGTLYRNSRVLIRDITDGTSNTFIVGELSGLNGSWASWVRAIGVGTNMNGISAAKNVRFGINLQTEAGGNFNNISFGSMHPGGAHFAMGDAKIKFVSENIDLNVYFAQASRDGREPNTGP